MNFEPRALEVAVNPFRVDDGYVTLPTAPGLGIELREEMLGRYTAREFPPRSIPEPRDEGP